MHHQSTDSPSPGALQAHSQAAFLVRAPSPAAHGELRGWLMVLVTVVASIAYSSGLSPPGGFERVGAHTVHGFPPAPAPRDALGERMMPVLYNVSPSRYITFYFCNTAALALSLSIVLLLASLDLRRLARTKALEVLLALDLLALLVAYVAGSTFGAVEYAVSSAVILMVPVALVVMSSRLCGKYFWDEL